jgi:transcriptional regulator with XRE-family HTH domain
VIRHTQSVVAVVANEVTSPDELIKFLKRYLRKSNQSERAVASRIGINHHTLNRWLTTKQSPTKGRLALAACFLRRVGYL